MQTPTKWQEGRKHQSSPIWSAQKNVRTCLKHKDRPNKNRGPRESLLCKRIPTCWMPIPPISSPNPPLQQKDLSCLSLFMFLPCWIWLLAACHYDSGNSLLSTQSSVERNDRNVRYWWNNGGVMHQRGSSAGQGIHYVSCITQICHQTALVVLWYTLLPYGVDPGSSPGQCTQPRWQLLSIFGCS